MIKEVNPLHYALITIIGALLFMPFSGSVHLFDWDEINFAESAREMIVTGNYTQVQIDYQAFWEKPPLFIWMQVVSMKIFGINEFAARFPNAVFGILTLCLIFHISKKIFKGHIAHWWVMCYLGAITPHLYFKTGLIDPVFNFFIFLSIYQFYKVIKLNSSSYNSNRHFLMAGIYSGIAILCKGPVALLVAILLMLSLVFAKRMVWFFSFGNLMIYLFTTAIVTSIWFIPETIKNGPYFIMEFINYQAGLFSKNIAGHEQPFYYHPLVLLFGCFPVSIIAIAGWKRNEFYTYNENLFRTTMVCLFWVVLILFSIVRTKIVHYSSLCWLPLTFMGAYAIESINHKIFKFRWYYKIALIFFGVLIATAVMAFPLIMTYNRGFIVDLIKDDFSKQCFSAIVNWGPLDILPGLVLLSGIILFIVYLFKGKSTVMFGFLLLSTTLFTSLASVMLVPKTEQHTQRIAIDFFRSLEGKNVYIFNVGYKTYAPYFYARTQPLKYTDRLNLLNEKFLRSRNAKTVLQLSEEGRNDLNAEQKYWLQNGNIDKPVYFIAKTDNRQNLDSAKNLVRLWDRNGFVTYMRNP